MTTTAGNQVMAMFDTQWVRDHVEGHLVFGPLARRFSLAWVVLALLAVYGVVILATTGWPSTGDLLSLLDKLPVLIVPLFMLRLSRYHQAAIGWCTTKICGALLAFLLLVAGALPAFMGGKPDAPHMAILALIWMPGVEFIPALARRQKSITVTRSLLSLPLLYLWYRTGTWSW